MSKERNKERWHTLTLPDLADNLDRRRVPLTKADRIPGPYPYYGASGIVDYVEGYLFEGEALLISEDGANLLARSTPIAFPATGKYWVNNHAHILKFKNVVTQRFVELYLESIRLDRYITGTAQPKLNQSALNSIPINIPISLQEQERIVAILDEAFEGIAAARTNVEMSLTKANDLLDVELQLLLPPCQDGWKQLTLADVASDYGRGKSKHRPRNDPKLYRGAYPFVQTGDVRNAKQYVTTYSQTYSDLGLSQSKLWPKGTLCVTIAANIAETAILDFDACFPDSVIGIVANPTKANTRFIEYQLRVAKAQLQAKGKGSAQDNINLGTFETHTFSFPPLAVQEALVERLDSVALLSASLTDVLQQKFILLDELRQSLLNQAFSGSL